MSSAITLWQGNVPAQIPANAHTAESILPYAHSRQLTKRDAEQITYAFNSGHYEMASNFIWSKSLASLKAQLSTLGTGFIAEMLDRPDIDQSSSVAQALTDYEALRLAHELGAISSTGYLRLRQALERITHFGQLVPEESGDVQMTTDEAIGVIRACVENILGQERIDAALDFRKFRDQLESKLFDTEDREVVRLASSPYFFQRASIRILLGLVKTKAGAQLENALANANVIIPILWGELLAPEKFQIGRAYFELVGDGKSAAAIGLKKALLKVKGFDFVPEDLRSKSFIAAAQRVLEAHEGMNNFYNEPAPMKALEEMGSVIPRPAFSHCMTAVLSVRLGNFYGISYDAQRYAKAMIDRVPRDRWIFYLDGCLPADNRVLEKLQKERPFSRWVDLVVENDLTSLADEIKDRNVRQLVAESRDAQKSLKARQALSRILQKLGYAGNAN